VKAAFLALALVACGGTSSSIEETDGGATSTEPDAAVTCWLGARGGEVSCDPNEPWWFVASSDGVTDTFARCSTAACPLKIACFVGSVEGYCR